MKAFAYIFPSLIRNPRRTGAYLVGTVIAVGLLSSVLFFVVGAAQVLTQRSIASVRPDMQVLPTASGSNVTTLRHTMATQQGVAAAERFALASFSSSDLRVGSRLGQTGAGKIAALDSSYFTTFNAPVIRQGSFSSGGVVISQDLGTNLGARVGDTITLHLPGSAGTRAYRVTGVASMLNTDLLFAPLDPVARANPFNPPANVVLMDYTTFEQSLKPTLLRGQPAAPSTGSVVVRTQAPVIEQVHLRLDRSVIPSDPAQAKTYTTTLLHRIELASGGRLVVVDNVAAALDIAQTDVLWAQVIFVFLALPGVILAAALARYVTATVIDAQRRELALLRIRGLGPRQLLTLLGSALLALAVLGVLLGLVAGWVTARVSGGAQLLDFGPLFVRTVVIAFVGGLVLGLIGTFWPLASFVRAPVVEGRRRVGRGSSPLWTRLYLDFAALIVGCVVYLITQRNGFQPVLNAEGNPTISLSFFTFLAPLLFWIGAVLVLARFSRGLVRKFGGALAGVLGRRGGIVGDLAARTFSRRAGSLHQAVVLVAMAVAFSSGLAIFVETYTQQQRVDAELTLGSDVKVSIPDRSQSGLVRSKLAVPGASAVTPFRSTVAYVGAEIQDIFGIDVSSFTVATHLTNSFFTGSSAAGTLDRLHATPNGIIVSAETARDYSLNLGDSLRLRMLDHQSGRYVAVLFRMVGVAREFATAPKDAFLVANLTYMQAATHDHGVDAYLVKSNGSASGLAATYRQTFAAGPTVHVQDLSSVQQQLATSLTSLDLGALSRIDYIYTLVIVLTGLLVFALAVLLERGRDFALLEVLGVSPAQIRNLLLIEIGYALVVGSILGLLVGLGFAQMLIQILTSIFDPPPDVLALPWSSLGLIVVLVVLAGAVAWGVASARLGRSNLATVLREA